jgi:single-strand DNA-binding protein
MSINSATITGNLTRDGELRATASGTSVLQLSVANNTQRKNPSTGEWEDYPNFIGCTLFGSRADGIVKYMLKGTYVALKGHLHQSRWADKDGKSREKLEIVINDIEWKAKGGKAEEGDSAAPAVGGAPTDSDEVPY